MAFEVNRAVTIALIAAISSVVSAPSWAEGNERGEDLFQLCTQCHGLRAEGNPETLAPAIAGMAQWYVEGQLAKFRDGLRGTHFDDIAGMRMRPMALTLRKRGDIEAVAAYVAGMPTTSPVPTLAGGDAAKGETLFAPCTVCHGMNAVGNPATFAPPLANASDWYLKKQLESFKSGIRGSNPGDPYGAMMRPMAMTLVDEQAVLDVIAHIMTLAN